MNPSEIAVGGKYRRGISRHVGGSSDDKRNRSDDSRDPVDAHVTHSDIAREKIQAEAFLCPELTGSKSRTMSPFVKGKKNFTTLQNVHNLPSRKKKQKQQKIRVQRIGAFFY